MAFSIKHDEADRLARELSRLTGETLTQAVVVALRERLLRQRVLRADRPLHEELLALGRQCSALPVLDARSPDQILGYDDHGLPH
jgi:antitoxin VapB